MPRCCSCSFKCNHGVFFAQLILERKIKGFMCERCFVNPHMFNPAKRDLSVLLFKVKMTEIPNYFAKKKYVENAVIALYSSRKAKREHKMIESLYEGQKQLSEVFA